MFSVVKWFERLAFVFLVSLLLMLGVFQGVQFQSFTFDLFFVVLDVVWLDAFFSVLMFSGFLIFSTSLFFVRMNWFSSSIDLESEEEFMCLIPTFQDSEYLEKSVGSLLESDYENFEILIICEESDDEAIERAEEFAESEKVEFSINDSYPGSKAGALNHGFEITDFDYYAVIDVDQKVDKLFLKKSANLLDKYEAVQGRNIPLPGNFMESFSYYDTCFSYIFRQLFSFFTGFTSVGSGCSAFTEEAWNKLGGFDTETLTEDYEISHRCYVNHISTAEILDKCSEEESAASFMDWWCQRKRWIKGNIQVLFSRFNEVRKVKESYRYLISPFIALSAVLGITFTITLVSKFLILVVLGSELTYSLPLILIILISILVGSYDRKYNSIDSPKLLWILSPLIFPLFGLIAAKSLIEILMRSNHGWYNIKN